jgi:hypothetical protein
MPRSHAVVASLCSKHMTTTSIATPITTSPVDQGNNRSQLPDDVSRAIIAFSRADMALSRAEASLGRLEALQIRCAKITLFALLCLIAVKTGVLIIGLHSEKGENRTPTGRDL